MDELERIIRDGRESLGVEFKSALDWSDMSTKAKLTKAALAMANLRDGGVLVIGMRPTVADPSVHELDGLTPAQLASYDPDNVMAFVNAHAAPSIDMTVTKRSFDGQSVVAVGIREFRDIPTICAQHVVVNGRNVVVRGRMYCRSRRMPETAEVGDPEDLREIINLAVEKQVARHWQLRSLEPKSLLDLASRFSAPDGESQFRDQLEGL